MFEVATLGSGSAGNAMLVRGASTAFLVDAGLTAKQLATRLAVFGVRLEDLSGVLITHEHSDHMSALKVLLNRHQLPVYCNPMTARALNDGGLQNNQWKFFQNGSDFTLGEFVIRPFSVPHDAADPVGFRITTREVAFGVLTDLGHATKLAMEMLRGVEGLFIESNHCEEMLINDPRRPWALKNRIRSKHGHLSNKDAAQVLAELDAPALRHVILGHLSRDCNMPHLAENLAKTALETAARGTTTYCATQEAPSPRFSFI